MKASFGIVLGAVCAMSLGGCVHEYSYESHETAAQAADGCVADIEHGKTPQIMTYDTGSKVETHVKTFPDGATMTVQDRQANKATGVDATVGKRPYSCYADGQDHNEHKSKKSWGWGDDNDNRDYKSGSSKSTRDGAQ